MDSKKQEALDIATGAIKVAVKTLERAASMSAAIDEADKHAREVDWCLTGHRPGLPFLRRGAWYIRTRGRRVCQIATPPDGCADGKVYCVATNTWRPADVTIELPGGAQ